MAAKRSVLAELMGSAGADAAQRGLQLSHLPELLGEGMPELPRNPVGRHRLIRSLQQRFGPNFRSLPGIKDLVKQFDDEIALEVKVQRMKAIKARSK